MRPAVERIGALAALCLDELGREFEAFRFGEAPHCLSLGIDSETGLPLSLRGNAVERVEALGEQLDGGKREIRRKRVDDRPNAGTRLIREWQRVEHCVTVRADDFEYQGRPYKSLSSVARAITGTRWNGWVFFGLKNQRGRG